VTALAVAYWFMGASVGMCLALLIVSAFTLRAAHRYYTKTLQLAHRRATRTGRLPTVEEINQVIADAERFTRDHRDP
jgi:hypothetical protein